MDKICHEHNVKLNISDYRSDLELAKKSKELEGVSYYDNAPVEEILRFASVGTSIAFEVLEQLEKGIIKNDAELSRLIRLALAKEFRSDYKWMNWALHFVCNTIGIPPQHGKHGCLPKPGMCCSRVDQSSAEIN